MKSRLVRSALGKRTQLPIANPLYFFYYIFIISFISLMILILKLIKTKFDVYNFPHRQQSGLSCCSGKAEYKEIQQENIINNRAFNIFAYAVC